MFIKLICKSPLTNRNREKIQCRGGEGELICISNEMGQGYQTIKIQSTYMSKTIILSGENAKEYFNKLKSITLIRIIV
jgi:hypothetical protein